MRFLRELPIELEQLNSNILNRLNSLPGIQERALELTTELSDAPNSRLWEEEILDFTRFHKFPGKIRILLTLGIVHWYLPKEISCLINLQLAETDWPREYFEAKEFLLTSKEFALAYLLVQEHFNLRDFFGNYLDYTFERWFKSLWFARGRGGQRIKLPAHRKRGHRESSRSTSSARPEYLREEKDDVWVLEKEQIRAQKEQLYRNFILNEIQSILCPAFG